MILTECVHGTLDNFFHLFNHLLNRIDFHPIFAFTLQRYLIICHFFGQQMTQRYRRIAILAIFFSFEYTVRMLKFAGLKETGKQYTEGSVTQIILVSFYYFDGSYGSRILVPYFGTLLLLSFIDIIVTSGSYIPMTKTMFKTLSGSNGSSHRTNNLKNAETEVTAIDDQRFSFVKVTFSKIPRHGSNGI